MPPLDIPGYYYDAEKNRYFKIMKNSQAPASSADSQFQTRSSETAHRPAFITKDYIAKKKRREQIEAANSQTPTPASTTHKQRKKKKHRHVLLSSTQPSNPTISRTGLCARPQQPTKSLYSILRAREIGSVKPSVSKDLVWELKVETMLSNAKETLVKNGNGGTFKDPLNDPQKRFSLDLRPWIYNGIVQEFDVHPSKPHVAIASDSGVNILSLHQPTDLGSKFDVISSLRLQEASAISNVEFGRNEEMESDFFVSSCLGGARPGSFQLYMYDTDIEGKLKNSSLLYRYSPSKSSVWTCAAGGIGTNSVFSGGGSKGQVFITTNWKSRPTTSSTNLKSSISDVFSQTWHPSSNNLLVCGSRSGTIHGVDRRSMQSWILVDAKTRNNPSPVCDLSFGWGIASPDLLLSTQMNGDVKVWDLRNTSTNVKGANSGFAELVTSAKSVNSFTKLNACVVGGGFVGGRGVLVGGGSDGYVRAWKFESGRSVANGRVVDIGDDEMTRFPIRVKHSCEFRWGIKHPMNALWIATGTDLNLRLH
ncbi:WD40 repeat-like protein [Rhizoclosmatium globosum]|uniref:WD40 repeat-like protein n=1 Tax=Rhizoclosmatium globosum TaxID=329046 RepID=A0A1Y2CYF5_9FUNG|nr:WD40 repeat-like protein [Rhizoclosmatium globosum]|eukprot:ORY52063.1 WD40 repeat-like protein [Rhizoclosmatium globosum]